MNLDCPGCKARLKLDPAKLPPGATTAVCPKCRARVLLPGAAAASGDISVSCGACSARLRVNVARLKPAPSQSKCPKCGAAVTLPAATSVPRAAEASAPVSAQTRRLDPRELGVMMGTASTAGAPGMTAQMSTPIVVDDDLAQSDVDLGKLIDQKVDGLGKDASGRTRAVTPPAAMNTVEPVPLPTRLAPAPRAAEPPRSQAAPGPRPPSEAPREVPESGARSAPEPRRRSSDSGARPAPRPDAPAAASTAVAPAASRTLPLLAAGVVGGAVVSGALSLAERFVAAMLVPRAPEPLVSILGEKPALVVLMVLLSALASVLSGMARPPAAADPGEIPDREGISVFRSAVAAALMGLLAGIGISLAQGGFDPVATLTWTLGMTLCGLAAAPVASLLLRRRNG